MELLNMWRIQALIEENRDLILRVKELERKVERLIKRSGDSLLIKQQREKEKKTWQKHL